MQTLFRQRGAGIFTWLLGLILVAVVLVTVYVWAMMSWSYSDGERAGWVQKLSNKGWLCKTWEGEMAMVSMPGAIPEKFLFTVRDAAVAAQINDAIGRRVSVSYEEHIGLPTNCFGDTRHFVKAVKPLEDLPSPRPLTPPAVPHAAPPVTPPATPAVEQPKS